MVGIIFFYNDDDELAEVLRNAGEAQKRSMRSESSSNDEAKSP